MDMTVRKAMLDDFAVLDSLPTYTGALPTYNEFQQIVMDAQQVVFVAEAARNQVIGYVYAREERTPESSFVKPRFTFMVYGFGAFAEYRHEVYQQLAAQLLLESKHRRVQKLLINRI